MMNMIGHTLRIDGPQVSAGKPLPIPLGNVLRQIGAAVKESVGMGFRRSSRMRGRTPNWLTAAADVRFVGLGAGDNDSTLLHFEAPRFGAVAEEPYCQMELFEPPPAKTDTAFDLLGDILSDLTHQVTDSDRFDLGLLRRFEGFGGTIFKKGIDSITIGGDRLSVDAPPRIDREIAGIAASLYRQTPEPKRVRMVGKLDMIRDSDRVFGLILESGEKVRGVWAGGDTGTLAELFKNQVVIDGAAIFRASGSLLRVDAEGMAPASDQDKFFSKMPKATEGRDRCLAKRIWRYQTASNGANAIYDQWPGEESEEELLAALGEMD